MRGASRLEKDGQLAATVTDGFLAVHGYCWETSTTCNVLWDEGQSTVANWEGEMNQETRLPDPPESPSRVVLQLHPRTLRVWNLFRRST